MMNNSMNNGASNNNNNSNNGGFIMATGTIRGMEAFAGTVKSAMEAYFGEDYKVQVHTVVKNNDLHLTGLTILNRSVNIAPTIYLEHYYEMYKDGETMANVCREIIRIYEEYKVTENFDTSCVTDFNRVKDRICYKLINAKQNKELLADTPYLKLHDLAIIFYVMVSDDAEGLGTVTVRNHIMNMWNVGKEELFELAIQNTQRLFKGKVTSIADVLMEALSARLDEEYASEFFDMMVDVDDMLPMYVCTNTAKINGAGTILYNGLLKEFADRMDSNIYIIPSSIHETILIPASIGMSVDEIRDMVKCVNATEVAPEEILSDSVYYYNRLTDRVEMA